MNTVCTFVCFENHEKSRPYFLRLYECFVSDCLDSLQLLAVINPRLHCHVSPQQFNYSDCLHSRWLLYCYTNDSLY